MCDDVKDDLLLYDDVGWLAVGRGPEEGWGVNVFWMASERPETYCSTFVVFHNLKEVGAQNWAL